jgi:hypothetical protein
VNQAVITLEKRTTGSGKRPRKRRRSASIFSMLLRAASIGELAALGGLSLIARS